MIVLNRLVKCLLVAVLATVIVGCASAGGIASGQLTKQKNSDKEIYGVVVALAASGKDETKEICDTLKNSDPRCLDQKKYKAIAVMSKFGFSDGGVGLIALVDRDSVGETCVPAGIGGTPLKCTYVKAKEISGQLSELVEVVSRPGENVCHWGGLPRAGGVVCPKYNWDYSKEKFIGYTN